MIDNFRTLAGTHLANGGNPGRIPTRIGRPDLAAIRQQFREETGSDGLGAYLSWLEEKVIELRAGERRETLLKIKGPDLSGPSQETKEREAPNQP